MSRFENVKVGDVVMACHRTVGLKSFMGVRYPLEVWEAETVVKVTKTQFTTCGGRYQKSGSEVGGGSRAYLPGDKHASYQSDVPREPTPTEVIEEHERKISAIYNAGMLVNNSFKIARLPTVDEAAAVADLILQAHALYTERGAACL